MFAKLHAHQSTEIWYTIFLLLQREPYGNIWEFDKVFYMWPTEHKKKELPNNIQNERKKFEELRTQNSLKLMTTKVYY